MTGAIGPGDAPDAKLGVDSAYAWTRLVAALLLSTIGGVGMWSVVVVLPPVQAEFAAARSDVSLPYTLTMIGYGLGGMLMGRLADRFGILVPVMIGTVALAGGYACAGLSAHLWQFTLAQGLLIGVGSSATFAPLLADTSLWFARRRGIAVAIFASGNYLAGTVWPPVVQHFIDTAGWRTTYFGIALFCVATVLPLAVLVLRRRSPVDAPVLANPAVSNSAIWRAGAAPLSVNLSPGALQGLLILAGLSCCIAMSMPQVHIVAYCGDLGYGAARGAQMLSLMLGFGIVSRLASGWIVDHIGGVRTLLLGSMMQAVALALYFSFDGLTSLYIMSILFGLFQGGIVPSYAIIVREYFPAREAGARVSAVFMATLFGMALGGWMSGVIFDVAGSYDAAFLNGLLWNLVNVAIAAWLLRQGRPRLAAAT